MNYSFLAITFGIFVALASAADAGPKKIRTAADFDAQVVGKTLIYGDGGYIKLGPGSLKGKTGKGEKIVGAWNWQGKYFCRNLKIGSQKLPADCQTVVIDGSTISFIRNRGKGDRSTATLK